MITAFDFFSGDQAANEQERPAFLVMFCAIPGHGKTTTLQACVAREVIESTTVCKYTGKARPPRVFIFDPKKESHLIGANELSRDGLFPSLSSDWSRLFGKNELADLENTETFDDAGECCLAAMEADERNCIVILEELMTVDQVDYVHLKKAGMLRRKDRSGLGMRIFCTTQRPQTIPVSFRATADVLACGKIEETRDLAALGRVMGEEKANQFPNLPVGKWVLHKSSPSFDWDVPQPKGAKDNG